MTVDARALAGRRLWIGIPGATVDDDTARLLDAIRPGGIVLFRRNIESREQAATLVADLRRRLGPRLHVSVDQEHGLVVRFDGELTVFPGNMALGAAGMREPAMAIHLAEEQGRLSGAELAALGIDVNLAPVCDLAIRSDNPGLGVRSFSSHPALAAPLAAAIIRGHQAAGIVSCAKHFPGLGPAKIDSHIDLPVAVAGDLDAALKPFRAAVDAGVELVMTTHVAFSDLDGDTPTTFSRIIVQSLLRERLGFGGVVTTDDLEMGAMTRRFGFDDVLRGAAASGHDVFCICHDPVKQRRAFDLLAAAHAAGDAWAGDAVAIGRRLDALPQPRPAVALTASAAGAASKPSPAAILAEAIAGRAVTIIRDPGALIPIRAEHRVLLVLPAAARETLAEDPLRGASLALLRTAFGASVQVIDLPSSPTEADIAAVEAAARTVDRALIGTTLARFSDPQAALLRRASRLPNAILVALRNPFDFDVLDAIAPSDPSTTIGTAPAALVTAYGFRPVHERALLAVLTGRVAAYGRLPVELSSLRPPTTSNDVPNGR